QRHPEYGKISLHHQVDVLCVLSVPLVPYLFMNPDWRNRYELAITAAKEAGQLALRYFDTNLTIEWKKDLSPVTLADREAEALLRTRLLGAFPRDGFLGEESGDTPGNSGLRWIIDPIDG